MNTVLSEKGFGKTDVVEATVLSMHPPASTLMDIGFDSVHFLGKIYRYELAHDIRINHAPFDFFFAVIIVNKMERERWFTAYLHVALDEV